jgi:hypothetical protein
LCSRSLGVIDPPSNRIINLLNNLNLKQKFFLKKSFSIEFKEK